MKKKKASFSHDGFGLIEVLISISLASVVALGIASSIHSILQSSSHLHNLSDVDEIQEYVNGLFSNPTYCGLHFNGTSVPLTIPSNIVSNVDLKEVTAGGALGSATLLSLGVQYNHIQIDSLALNIASQIGVNRYLAYINSTISEQNGYKMTFNKQSPLMVITDNARKVIGCNSFSAIPESKNAKGVYTLDCSIWSSMGWRSKNDCLMDGKLHLVQDELNMGPANADLTNAIIAGAKVTLNYVNAGGVHINTYCSTAFTHSGYAYCMRPISYGGSILDNVPAADNSNSFSGTTPIPHSTWGHLGAPVIRSDGHTRGVASIPTLDNGINVNPKLSVSIGTLPSLRWFVKY